MRGLRSDEPALSASRTTFLALARALNALFFLVTATYCVLTYSSFAYQQFIRPHLVASLTSFVIWHHLWHWVALGLTTLTLVPELKRGRGRGMAWAYLIAMTGVGVVLLVRPILPSVENDGLGLRLAFLSLLPPVWLAAYDHVATTKRFAPTAVDDRRILASGLVAAVAVWAMHIAATPLRLDDLGDLPMSKAVLAFGSAASLFLHVGLFASAGMLFVAILRLAAKARDRGRAEYWLVVLVSGTVTAVVVGRLVLAALSFRGPSAWLLAIEVALALTLVWSGVCRRIANARARRLCALEAWFSPLIGSTARPPAWLALVVLPIAAFAAVERVAMFDWDFLVQNLCLLGVWLLTFGYVYGAIRLPPRRLRALPATALASALLVPSGLHGPVEVGKATGLAQPSFVPELGLDAYAAVDPWYRLMRQLLWVDPPGSSAFYQDLRANSLIEHVAVAPIDVDFSSPLSVAPVRPPHIFLFVVDSLRRDYVSAYNPAVSFTPSIGAFAAESDVFARAFTPYGGTGLAMPALWAGGMLLHKQYVLPFQRMNALEKLIKTNGYRSFISMDHITAQLLEADPLREELDRGRDELKYDLCATLDELTSKIGSEGANTSPIFAHTRSLNLHVSNLKDRGPVRDPARDGFQAPAAAAIGRLDRCFGDFIGFLKARRLYDDSIVVLTADHGDSLGEARRWGHSLTIFPEILRIPLIVHVPPRLRAGLTYDHDAVTLLTDLTPTLYGLLGYAPNALGWAYGAPLLMPPGADQSWRRRDTFLVASSYGPVYGLVEKNGEALYIADGVNARDFAYDLSSARPVRVGVTEARRASSRAVIRRRLEALAAMYHFTPPS